ncbi:hypothetical protein J437_LFUL007731 [Ladona fulva]|uniref:Scavenger receptor class B member 1 n=1 Tax=Ladona fulva TaxID=123851 RepID=A0A8K0K1Q8_LADFU|nr:hypothetical protein J437_LFUL007731 [Ladona fulva]
MMLVSGEKWEKVNLQFHDNGTVTFQQKKVFHFDAASSNGTEDDLVIVPNIPMLGIDSLPDEVLDLLYLATEVPPVVHVALTYGLIALGILLLLISLGCLVRSAGRQETLSLEASSHYGKPKPGANGRKPANQMAGKPMQNGSSNHAKPGKDNMDGLNPSFVEAPETGITG